MEKKRELTSVDLAALEGELGRHVGAKVDKAYLYDDDLLRLKLRDFEHGRVELLVQVGELKRAYAADPAHVADAPGRPPDFAMMLRNRIENAELAAVEQFEFDRILELTFERGDGSTRIVAELFGDGNVAVLDEHGDVVDCLETVRLKSRTVAPGAPYEFPSARFNPLTVDREGFLARMRDSDADVVRTLATQLNFGGLYGEELCTRAGVEYNLPVAEATDEQLLSVYDAVDGLAEQLRSGDLDPRVYHESTGDGDDDRRRVDVTPVPLEEYAGLESERFDSFNAALDDFFHNFEDDAGDEGAGGGRERPDFESEIARTERIIEQQEGAIEEFEADAAAEREKAESLYADYDLVDEVLSTVRDAREGDTPWSEIEERFEEGARQGIAAAEAVRRVDAGEGTVTLRVADRDVELDPWQGVEQNADRLYTEAKRIEEKKQGALAAIEETREELAEIRERRDAWEAEESGTAGGGAEADESDGDEQSVDWLSEPSIPIRTGEEWYERFRWFHTSDGFLVIGGRDADQNEDLVKKYLERGDHFYHAQAHGGPVTVLKGTGPSEPTREVDVPDRSHEEAARFAVSYSSVWKDGRYAGDVYRVDPDQVSKTPESGEYLEKGGFAIRGNREYFRDVAVGVAVGITCEDETRVIGGPPSAIEGRAETSVRLEPGRYAQNDAAKRVYRELKSRFADETFVRKVASPDLIQEFLPPGGSRMVD